MIVFILLSITANSQNLKENDKNKTNNKIEDLLFASKVKLLMKITNTPSLVVTVIDNDSVLWSNAYGYRNVFLRKKAELDSIYIIGSISKTFIATSIMQLYERGLLNLDDDVSLYLPYELKNPNFPNVNISFRMLLAHQASLNDGFFDIPSYFPLSNDPCEWIRDRLVPGGKKYDIEYWKNYCPGKYLNYSNWGFILLSALLEEISGQSFEEYCRENIFEPLNMSDTSFKLKKLDRRKLARPYLPIIPGLYCPLPNYEIKCASACGGLRTTVLDLSNYFMAHINQGKYKNYQLLNYSTVELMHSIQYPNSSSKFYIGDIQHGLGWIHMNLSGDILEGYNGGAIGYSCDMVYRTSNNVGVIMFSNNHFKRSNKELANFKLDLRYELADLFIDRALHN